MNIGNDISVIDGHSVGIVTAGIVYLRQFIHIYCPLALTAATIIGIIFQYRLTPEERLEQERQHQIEVIKSSKQYSHFTDDRRSRKGDENDIYMLKTHGYEKFRFLSNEFIKRNRLKRPKRLAKY